jgi:predicted ATPase
VEERPLIKHIEIKGAGCIKQAELSLSRLHALIGPNDSGKSTLLRALMDVEPSITPGGIWREGHWRKRGEKVPRMSNVRREQTEKALHYRVLLRLDPDSLRQPTNLLPTGSPLRFGNERGEGLAGLYDALLSRDRRAFIELEGRLLTLFPTVKALRLDNVDKATKSLGLTLHDGQVVGAKGMSEGMLYWLAFAILEHLNPIGVLLIEEPETGLHPSRIRDVMQVLRKISEQTQIVLATHSPLVINELQPEEVTIVTRTPERGTICTPMTQTKNFKERSEVYALGELWLSYADGDLEKEMVGDGNDGARE